MYKYLITVAGLLMCLGLTTSCNSQSKRQHKEDKQVNLVGNDKDNHGCIASAGYQWSELLRDCIRPFEKGVKLVSATEEYASSAAYLVFNEDTTKVEIFMPKEKVRPILTLTPNEDKTTAWKSSVEGKISVSCSNNKWSLMKEGKPIFTQE